MRVPGIPYVQGRNDYTDVDGRKYGIAIHNTANDASDEGEAAYATRRTDGISSHFYCDADSVIQSIDTDDRVGHAGSAIGNENAIAVEITGGNGMSRAWWLANVAWDKLGWVLAYVITHDPDFAGFQVRRASVAEMKTNPRVKAFYGHNDMRLAWGHTTHTDPGPNFPWDRLFAAVNTALNPPLQEVPDMLVLFTDEGKKWVGDGVTRRPLTDAEASDLQHIASKGALKLTVWADMAEVANPGAFGAVPVVPEAVLSEAQVEKIAAQLIAATDNPLDEADKPAIVAALKQALREGVEG